MNEDIDYMIKLYKTTDLDWMGDKINNPCDLTRHHIIKNNIMEKIVLVIMHYLQLILII